MRNIAIKASRRCGRMAATTITRTALIAALVAPVLLPACTVVLGVFR